MALTTMTAVKMLLRIVKHQSTCAVTSNPVRVENLRYRNRILQEEYLTNIRTVENADDDTWNKLHNNLLECGVTSESINATILKVLINAKNLNAGMSYMKFLRDNKHSIHPIHIGTYFLLFCNSTIITDSEKANILDWIDILRTEYKDSCPHFIKQQCVIGLSCTDRLSEASNLLDEAKRKDKAVWQMYNCIIFGALRNKDYDLAWKYLHQRPTKDDCMQTFARMSFKMLQFSPKDKESLNMFMEQIFSCWNNSNLPMECRVLDNYLQHCKEFGLKANETTVSPNSVCLTCKQDLLPADLNDTEFGILAENVKQTWILDNSMYLKSKGEQFEVFKQFIGKTKPYDIVIDLMNIMYARGTPQRTAFEVRNLTRDLSKSGYKVLILGRKHAMQSFDFSKIPNLTEYFVDNIANDDLYLLYAALESGPKTLFVTNDFLRQYHAVLSPHCRQLFNRWTFTRRCSHSAQSSGIIISKPSKHGTGMQKVGNHWHIPYKDNRLTPIQKWLCIELKTTP